MVLITKISFHASSAMSYNKICEHLPDDSSLARHTNVELVQIGLDHRLDAGHFVPQQWHKDQASDQGEDTEDCCEASGDFDGHCSVNRRRRPKFTYQGPNGRCTLLLYPQDVLYIPLLLPLTTRYARLASHSDSQFPTWFLYQKSNY